MATGNRHARRTAAAKGDTAKDVDPDIITGGPEAPAGEAQFTERAYLFTQNEVDAMARGLYYLLGMAHGQGKELPGTVVGAFQKIEAISTQFQVQQQPQG